MCIKVVYLHKQSNINMLKKEKNIARLDFFIVLALISIAFIVRFIYIGKTDIGNDECFSLYYSRFSALDIMKALTTGAGFAADNPPLWEIILGVWTKIFGINLLALRSLSLLFNVLTIIPLYKLANEFFSKRIAISVSLLYVFSTFSLFLSHEGRVYSLVGFLAICSVYCFMKQYRNPSKFNWVLLLVSNVLLVYSHYMAAFWIIAMEVLTVIIFKDLRKTMWKALLFHIIGLLVFCFPLIPVVFERFMDSGLNGTWIKKCTGIEDFYSMLCTFTNAPVTTVLAITIMVSSLIKVAISMKSTKLSLSSSLLIVLFWTVPLVASFLLSFLVGFFLNRYFYFTLPLYLLTLVICINYLFPKRKLYRIITECIFLLAVIISFKMDSGVMRYAGWKGDVSKVSDRLIELKAEKDACVIISPQWIDKQLVYYFDEEHKVFANEGKLVEPVFQDYLRTEGYYYEYTYREEDYLRYSDVIIVHENLRDISSIVSELEMNGYKQKNCEMFLQMSISSFSKK